MLLFFIIICFLFNYVSFPEKNRRALKRWKRCWRWWLLKRFHWYLHFIHLNVHFIFGNFSSVRSLTIYRPIWTALHEDTTSNIKLAIDKVFALKYYEVNVDCQVMALEWRHHRLYIDFLCNRVCNWAQKLPKKMKADCRSRQAGSPAPFLCAFKSPWLINSEWN